MAFQARLRENRGVASHPDPLPAVGQAIARRRKAVGLTQEALAHEAGLSLRHLQKIEAGDSNPRLGTLFALAKRLDTTAHALLKAAAR